MSRKRGLATKARAVIGDDGDRSGDDVDDLAGVLVDQFEFATVVPQVVQAENAFGLPSDADGGLRIGASAGTVISRSTGMFASGLQNRRQRTSSGIG
jgi:hypothetical protein